MEKPRLAIKQHLLTLAGATLWPPFDWDVGAWGPQHVKLVKGTSPDEGISQTVWLQREATSCINHKVGATGSRKRKKKSQAGTDEMLQVQGDNDKFNASGGRMAAANKEMHPTAYAWNQDDEMTRSREPCQQRLKNPEDDRSPRDKGNKKKLVIPNKSSHHYILALSHRRRRG